MLCFWRCPLATVGTRISYARASAYAVRACRRCSSLAVALCIICVRILTCNPYTVIIGSNTPSSGITLSVRHSSSPPRHQSKPRNLNVTPSLPEQRRAYQALYRKGFGVALAADHAIYYSNLGHLERGGLTNFCAVPGGYFQPNFCCCLHIIDPLFSQHIYPESFLLLIRPHTNEHCIVSLTVKRKRIRSRNVPILFCSMRSVRRHFFFLRKYFGGP